MKDLEKILTQNFNLTNSENLPDSESEYLKMLTKKLAQRIKFYINTDLDFLLQALYRIDIPQQHSDQAFALGEIDKVSLDLAEKIIQRQLKKIAYSKSFYQRDDE
ncbi:MAG: hypothetical protein CME65_06110 [Halobacteriovoraceae bacterium]|nr:hypothetical protein [Halobacteriovoraceae bacterium]|tara:strand:+ start:1694 stop:2008 length:315 start_codon:yes stop_codon:yes gene_type:complete